MKQFLGILAIGILTLLCPSCKKDVVEDPNHTDYETDLQQFEAVWNGLNTAYVFWPVDNTDWDAVYEKYRPIFEDMEIQPDSIWESTWKALTTNLIDHHLTIKLERPTTGYRTSLIPGLDEVMSRSYFHAPMGDVGHLTQLLRLQLNGRLTDVSFMSATDIYVSGILDGEIAYFYCSGFSDYYTFLTPFSHFKQLVASDGIKAAIIDVRDNGGGNAIIPDAMYACFSTETPTIGVYQTKIGLGRYELGPKLPYNIGSIVAENDRQNCDIPVVVLTNVFSASASEITSLAIKSLPNGYVVGERTYGATCALNSDFGLFYSGSFGDSQEDADGNWSGHGHYVYTPKYLFTGVDDTLYEGYGVEPDEECLFDQSAWDSGVDNQLEYAVSFVQQKM